MERSAILWCLAVGLAVILNTHEVQATLPIWLSTQGRETFGFKDEAVNFTWSFSNHSLVESLYFGTWNTENGYWKNILVTVFQTLNGNTTFHWNKRLQQFQRRLRWVGNVSQGLAKFELSGVRHADNLSYALEVYYLPEANEVELSSLTKLIVLDPSEFTFSSELVSRNLGEEATFIWNYELHDGDKKALSYIAFGVYKDGSYKSLCFAEIKNKLVSKTNCSMSTRAHIGAIDPTTRAEFVLNQIGVEHEAVYSIRLGGTLRNMESKTRLVVTDPPKFVEPPKSTIVMEGINLNLTCIVKGRPHPMIKWLKDGETLEINSTELLTIDEITREDAGHYKCVAENNVGKVTSSPSAYVNVHYAPAINISKKVQMIYVPVGRNILLKCPTIANPPATVQWFANGILDKSDNDTLQVKIKNSYDYANYTCVAKNSAGEDNVTFVFREVGPPSNPPIDCDMKNDASQQRTFIFHWNSPKNDGGALVKYYTIKHRSFADVSKRNVRKWKNINVTSRRTWYKFKLEGGKTFEFTITASNKYGESAIDLDNTCLISIAKDSALLDSVLTTGMPTQDIVAAAAKKNTKDKTTVANLWLYVGIGAGGFVIAVLALSIYCHRKRKRSKKADKWYNHHASFNALIMEGNMLDGPSVNTHFLQGDSQLGTRKQSMVGSPRYQMDPEWFIPREKICILKVIGNGAFGLVHKGRVHGIGPNTLGWNLVAIKSPYADASESEVRDLMKEFELIKTLKPHPHVIKLLGCGEDEGRPLVIIEYVPFGDLLGYLRKSRGENDEYYSDPEIKPNTNLSSQQLLRFGWHVADGMAYLATQKILHRDLAARNVLVGDGLSCKVTDFGMAKDVSNNEIYIRSTEGRLPVKWTAVEALTGGGEYTTKSDVWSFGVVLYEICTIGAEPFPGVAPKEIPYHVEAGYRMKRPGHVDPELYDVMMSCWETDADERPTFPELKETLMKLEEVQSRDYINLTECLYQNISVRGTGPGSLKRGGKGGTLKGSVKGNPYHIGPGVQAHVTAV